jgi:hypothetical protein
VTKEEKTNRRFKCGYPPLLSGCQGFNSEKGACSLCSQLLPNESRFIFLALEVGRELVRVQRRRK